MSQNSGPPKNILSKRAIKLLAPAGVLGGKNSKEKNLSPFSVRDRILSMSVVVRDATGEEERVFVVESEGETIPLLLLPLRDHSGSFGNPTRGEKAGADRTL